MVLFLKKKERFNAYQLLGVIITFKPKYPASVQRILTDTTFGAPQSICGLTSVLHANNFHGKFGNNGPFILCNTYYENVFFHTCRCSACFYSYLHLLFAEEVSKKVKLEGDEAPKGKVAGESSFCRSKIWCEEKMCSASTEMFQTFL